MVTGDLFKRSFKSGEVKKKNRRTRESADKSGIDGKEKGNKMLCEKLRIKKHFD